MIPKIIHYCWLSTNPIPKKFQKYMWSWKKHLSKYEFILWDFNRFEKKSSIWVSQAFDQGKYSFASDYVRLYAIYNYGGIYLDMDVEVLRPFDELLETDIMIAYEDDNSKAIEVGCFGAVKGNHFIKKCLNYYADKEFSDPKNLPIVMGDILQKSFKDNTINIYPPEYFTAKSFYTGRIFTTPNTFTIHHFAGTWLAHDEKNTISRRWTIFKIFGDNSLAYKILRFQEGIFDLYRLLSYPIGRIKEDGIGTAFGYYWRKYINRKHVRQ
jgi:mannosyltransferase OCH1-like enzyme